MMGARSCDSEPRWLCCIINAVCWKVLNELRILNPLITDLTVTRWPSPSDQEHHVNPPCGCAVTPYMYCMQPPLLLSSWALRAFTSLFLPIPHSCFAAVRFIIYYKSTPASSAVSSSVRGVAADVWIFSLMLHLSCFGFCAPGCFFLCVSHDLDKNSLLPTAKQLDLTWLCFDFLKLRLDRPSDLWPPRGANPISFRLVLSRGYRLTEIRQMFCM